MEVNSRRIDKVIDLDSELELSLTKMSLKELEGELELLKNVYNIFDYSNIEVVHEFSSVVKDALKMYGDRIRQIENEIFERSVLVQS